MNAWNRATWRDPNKTMVRFINSIVYSRDFCDIYCNRGGGVGTTFPKPKYTQKNSGQKKIKKKEKDHKTAFTGFFVFFGFFIFRFGKTSVETYETHKIHQMQSNSWPVNEKPSVAIDEAKHACKKKCWNMLQADLEFHGFLVSWSNQKNIAEL